MDLRKPRKWLAKHGASTVLVLAVPAAQDLAVLAEQEALVSPDFHRDQMAAIRNTISMATWMIF